jgi:glycosyltransferase involved in cell wall biosynthesis
VRAVLQVFAPYGRTGGSARVRVFQWLEHTGIRHHLHDYVGTATLSPLAVLSRPGAALRREVDVRRRFRSPDSVLIHRAVTPLSRGEVESRILRGGRLGVYDFDDAIQWEPPLPDLAHRLFPRAGAAVAAVQAADRVIAGNSTLAEWAAGHNADVRVIPSCVEPGYYVRKRSYELSDPPVLGWIGSASTERYLDAIAPALLEVHRQTGAVLVIVGAAAAKPGQLDPMIRRIPWTETIVHNRVADWDIGLTPLADRLYERGKCGYKLIQYGAAALPAVGSPVGVNRELLSGMAGLAPTSTVEWVDALLSVINATSDEREAMGATARRLVDSSYSYSSWAEQWCAAVESDQPTRLR